MAITFLTFGAYSTIMPYAKREDNFYALAAQAIIFFNLMSSLAQPLGAGMDVVLSSLLIGFTGLSLLLSTPLRKRLKSRVTTNKHAQAKSAATDEEVLSTTADDATAAAPAADTPLTSFVKNVEQHM